MTTRREFIKISCGFGACLFVSNKFGFVTKAFAVKPVRILDPGGVAKFSSSLPIPPVMPSTGKLKAIGSTGVEYYEIGVRQFTQQILPDGLPVTTVLGYGSVNHPESFSSPASTIEATWQTPVRVKWINELVDGNGNCLPPLLPVDPTLHWANPPGGNAGRDTRPVFSATPAPYTGPVPIVTHLHGGHSQADSDGFPAAWFLPASGVPAGYASVGSYWDSFSQSALQRLKVVWEPGSATYQYENDQYAATLWYHDHTLGMTRANVYAGLSGFYLLRGGPGDKLFDAQTGLPAILPGPAPAQGDAAGITYREIPVAIQDRSFNDDGSLFYPDTREFFDAYTGPYIPDTDVPPIWNPEFFGNTMVVNGRTWPYLEVEPRRYRFRLLNGCGSRFLILRLSNGASFWQIGGDGGYLKAPVQLGELLLAPAERADIIIDFAGMENAEVILENIGPDEPFGGGIPGVDFPSADPATTGRVMKFVVAAAGGIDDTTPPAQLTLPALPPLGAIKNPRQVSLNEMMSMYFDGPVAAMLGTVDLTTIDPMTGFPTGVHMMFDDPVTERIRRGATETWEIYNFTEDAHPIHIHQVQFEVVDRQPIGGMARPPEPWERGRKDTVVAYPGEITRLRARFDIAGLYVWHCHILEHEDNVMMRPMVIY